MFLKLKNAFLELRITLKILMHISVSDLIMFLMQNKIKLKQIYFITDSLISHFCICFIVFSEENVYVIVK